MWHWQPFTKSVPTWLVLINNGTQTNWNDPGTWYRSIECECLLALCRLQPHPSWQSVTPQFMIGTDNDFLVPCYHKRIFTSSSRVYLTSGYSWNTRCKVERWALEHQMIVSGRNILVGTLISLDLISLHRAGISKVSTSLISNFTSMFLALHFSESTLHIMIRTKQPRWIC